MNEHERPRLDEPESGPAAWPPLITTARIPLWRRARQVFSTLLAWGVLAWLLERPLRLAWDYLMVVPRFELTTEQPIDWLAKWTMMEPFLVASALIVAWVVGWALLRRRPLAAQAAEPPPPVLTADEHGADFGLSGEQLAAWRTPRLAIARFDAAQRLRTLEAPAPPSPVR